MLYTSPRKGWNFAIVRTDGNTEKLLKLFGEDDKEEAKAYGRGLAAEHPEWCISCIRARFDMETHKRSATCEVFEVWYQKETDRDGM